MWLDRRRQRDTRLGLGRNVGVGSARLMMSIHDGSLDCRRLNQILRHMGWSQVGTSRLGLEFGLNIDACLCQ